MKKNIFLFAFFFSTFLLFSQSLTSKAVFDEAVKKENPDESVKYIQSRLEKVTEPSEKRALYAYLGSLQELLSQYKEAQKSYATAAGIAAGSATGMPKKSNERLVLDAVRCALCSGESESALNYLNSNVRNSKSEEIQAEIKLYEQWAKLSVAEDSSQVQEPTEILKTYLNLPSMSSVRHSILLTLWYVTGEKSYSERLLKEYPLTPEAGIVTGNVQVLPTPFWFFLPRHKDAQVVIEKGKGDSVLKKDAAVESESVKKSDAEKSVQPATETSSEAATQKALKLQLGLFREKGNALSFVERLSQKGFSAYVQEEKRASGTTYYIVVIDENSEGTMGLKLKSAGFENYPIF